MSTDQRRPPRGRRAPARVGGAGPAQDGPDPGHELAGREGLGDVVVGAELEPEDPVDLVVAGGEHHDGDVAGGAQPPAHVEAVELARQADVDDHQLGPVPVDVGEALLAVVGLQHPEALASQVQGDQVGDVVVVLDDHDGVPVGWPPAPACHRASRPTGSLATRCMRIAHRRRQRTVRRSMSKV